jgi:hypothetical protein
MPPTPEQVAEFARRKRDGQRRAVDELLLAAAQPGDFVPGPIDRPFVPNIPVDLQPPIGARESIADILQRCQRAHTRKNEEWKVMNEEFARRTKEFAEMKASDPTNQTVGYPSPPPRISCPGLSSAYCLCYCTAVPPVFHRRDVPHGYAMLQYSVDNALVLDAAIDLAISAAKAVRRALDAFPRDARNINWYNTVVTAMEDSARARLDAAYKWDDIPEADLVIAQAILGEGWDVASVDVLDDDGDGVPVVANVVPAVAVDGEGDVASDDVPVVPVGMPHAPPLMAPRVLASGFVIRAGACEMAVGEEDEEEAEEHEHAHKKRKM